MPTALVTGASRGLGLELCRQLLARGCSVVAACRAGKSAGLDALQGDLKGAVTLKVVALDVAERESVLELARWLEAEAIALDFLFNNAGVALARDAQIEDPPLQAAVTTFLTNVVGPHSCLSAFLPALARAAGGAFRVINISSSLGSIGKLSTYVETGLDPKGGFKGTDWTYRVSKAALNMTTVCQALELKAKYPNAAVASVHPGWVQTDMGSSNGRTAPLTPEESIAGVLERAFELSPGRSGQYVDWTGATMPF